MKRMRQTSHDLANERRTRQRVIIDCPAELAMLSQRYPGRLVDLSLTGAQLKFAGPSAPQAAGMLRWLGNEFYCAIIWVNETACGIAFERPITREVLEATVHTYGSASAEIVGEVSQIPFGQKRVGLVR